MGVVVKICTLLSVIALLTPPSAVADEVKENIQKMATEFEAKYPGRIKVKIAILQFRTKDNQLTRFNQYLQDEFFSMYKNSPRFEVIDQVSVNRLLESSNWNLENSSSFEKYTELSEQLFRNVGVIPDAFIYGVIEDNIETITISGYIVPNGIMSNSIGSVIKFNSSEVTDQLLGKQVRTHSVLTDPAVKNFLRKNNFTASNTPGCLQYSFFKKEEEAYPTSVG